MKNTFCYFLFKQKQKILYTVFHVYKIPSFFHFFLMGANGKKKRPVSPEPLHICYFVLLFYFGERIPSTFSFSVSSLEK